MPVLRPALEDCVETGIELGDDSRVVVMLDEGGVGAALVERLTKRGVDVLAVEDTPEATELLERIDAWRDGADVSRRPRAGRLA